VNICGIGMADSPLTCRPIAQCWDSRRVTWMRSSTTAFIGPKPWAKRREEILSGARASEFAVAGDMLARLSGHRKFHQRVIGREHSQQRETFQRIIHSVQRDGVFMVNVPGTAPSLVIVHFRSTY